MIYKRFGKLSNKLNLSEIYHKFEILKNMNNLKNSKKMLKLNIYIRDNKK